MIKPAVSAYVETEKAIVGKKNFTAFCEYFNQCLEKTISAGHYHMFIAVKDMEYLTGSEYCYVVNYLTKSGYKVSPPIEDMLRISWEF